MLEKQLEHYFMRVMEMKNCLCWKFVSPGMAGVPDRIVIPPWGRVDRIVIPPWGRVIFVELKAPGKRLRKLQKVRREQLKAQNVDVWVIDSKEKVDKFVQYYGLDLI